MPDPAAVEVVPAVYGHGSIRSASSSHHGGVPPPKYGPRGPKAAARPGEMTSHRLMRPRPSRCSLVLINARTSRDGIASFERKQHARLPVLQPEGIAG